MMDLDKVYGVLERAWSRPRNDTALRRVQPLQCPLALDQGHEVQHQGEDEEGYSSMALVNKASGEAIKYSLDQSHPVTNLLASTHPSIQLLFFAIRYMRAWWMLHDFGKFGNIRVSASTPHTTHSKCLLSLHSY